MNDSQDWEQRLEEIFNLMKEISLQSDPQELVQTYRSRMDEWNPVDRRISLSRRGLEYPYYRITRFSEWPEEINPWKQKERLPIHQGGFFAELLYSNRPHIYDELSIESDDPAFEYLQDQNSLIAIPMLDNGTALNMVISTRQGRAAFDRLRFPETVWRTSLFGRATHNLVLKEEIKEAYVAMDRDLQSVSDIQHSLLPKRVPEVDHLQLAANYLTSERAGGDYYDFFQAGDNQIGLLIADVSGHGTPAAVVMAITHTIAHLFPPCAKNPNELLSFINTHLVERYTDSISAFVTAFYGVFDSTTRTLTYSNAGHNPPRLWRCREKRSISVEGAADLPLGIQEDVEYTNATIELVPGDRLVLYTDGITEAFSPLGDMFGVERLDDVLNESCGRDGGNIVDAITSAVERHCQCGTTADDRTLVVATVT